MVSGMRRVDTTLASAGTGKTYSLVGLIASAILDDRIEPGRIVATTFTVKAADELVERARARLVAMGEHDAAIGLLKARMGTINSVCGSLIREFALDIGYSPATEVIPEESQKAVFAIAADSAIAQCAPEMVRLEQLFSMPANKESWRDHVNQIIELARANGLDADAIRASGERSVAELEAILPPAGPETAEDLGERLRQIVDRALADLARIDVPKTSKRGVERLQGAAAALRRGEPLPWATWAALTKLPSTKAVEAIFDAVKAVASRHPYHPRLRADLAAFIRGCFACAADALDQYQRYKAERGLVDFADQEMIGLRILRDPQLQERLRERIGVVFIDEAQDCSPMQVALCAELARIAERSVWVGDPKQAIYAFRGSDARLTLAAAQGAATATGGRTDRLSTSWRSRPGIARFVNDAFAPVFAEAQGLPEDDCRFENWACTDEGLPEPPLAVWTSTGRKAEDRAASVAVGVAQALAEPSAWQVRDGQTVRPLRPGDVAVLCWSRFEIEPVASALSKLGYKVAVEHDDLFTAPEVQLALAALGWTADAGNRLALAEMARLYEGEGGEPDRWLTAALADDPDAELKALVPCAGALEVLREAQMALTPAEALDAVLETAGISRVSCRWGQPAVRLENLEALRGLARRYENESRRLRSPATVSGFLLWLEDQEVKRPRSLDPDAIQVMTYHKAKGLEWPMTVLCGLEKEPKLRLFQPTAEIDGEIDWREPLHGRWIRYWPWPYQRQQNNVGLDTWAAGCEIGRKVAMRNRDEAVRLLYVGVTRARDYAVLVRPENGNVTWLDQLVCGGAPHVWLPVEDGSEIRAGDQAHPARVRVLGNTIEVAPAAGNVVHLSLVRATRQYEPRRFAPSGAEAADAHRIASRVDFNERIAVIVNVDGALGEAVHAVLAADRRERSMEERVARAETILRRREVAGVSGAELVGAADRLWAHLSAAFPGARLRREVPVVAETDGRLTNGRIDLLVEGDSWFAIVDHKSYPGSRPEQEKRALGYAGQLESYARAVEVATGKSCRGLYVHMPIVGCVLEVMATHSADIGLTLVDA